MMNRTGPLAAALLMLGVASATAAQPAPMAVETGEPAADHRQLVEMPAKAQQLLREDMLANLAALNEIMGLLARGELSRAAEVAEETMGQSAMGRHRATGMGPGRFMPPAMRQMGWAMHEAASGFAKVAREGDRDQALAALQQVTGSCLVCHSAFRTR